MARLFTLRFVRGDGDRIVVAVMRDNRRAVKLGSLLREAPELAGRSGEVLDFVPPAVKAAIVANAPPVIEIDTGAAVVPVAVVNPIFKSALLRKIGEVLAKQERGWTVRLRELTQSDIDAINGADEAPAV